jgi:hypothetical protein
MALWESITKTLEMAGMEPNHKSSSTFEAKLIGLISFLSATIKRAHYPHLRACRARKAKAVAGESDQVVQLPQRLAEFASVHREAGAGRLNQTTICQTVRPQ